MSQPMDPETMARNALVFAAHGDLEKVKALLAEHPERINTPGVGPVEGEAPLAAAAHTHNRAIAEALLAHGAEHDIYTATFMGDRPRVEAFLARDPELAKTPGIHHIPILSFATDGALAALLIARGANVNAMSRAPFQTTPLHGAARRGYADVVAVLLDNGADATLRDYNGKTAPELASDPAVKALFARHGIAAG